MTAVVVSALVTMSTNYDVATVSVGFDPVESAYDSGRGEVFVSNGCGGNASCIHGGVDVNGSVSVISDSTNKVVATIPVGEQPRGVAYDSGKGEIFVADFFSYNVSVINDRTDKVVATIPVGNYPWGLAYDSGKGEVFVSVQNTSLPYTSSFVGIISDRTNSLVGTIPVGPGPSDVAYDSGKGEVFVVIPGSESVIAISDTSDRVVATIPVGATPHLEAFDSAKGEDFVVDVTNCTAGSCGQWSASVISDTTNTVVANISLGSTLSALFFGIAYDSEQGELFAANACTDASCTRGSVSIIDVGTRSVVGTIPLGNENGAFGVTYDSGEGEVFVTNEVSNSVSVISVGEASVPVLVGMLVTVLAVVSILFMVHLEEAGGATESNISSTEQPPEEVKPVPPRAPRVPPPK
jgi:YVTN family beta-propeller protein